MADYSTWKPVPNRKKQQEMSLEKRMNIFIMLSTIAKDGVLKKGAFVQAAVEFSIAAKTISSPWRTVNLNIQAYDLNNNNGGGDDETDANSNDQENNNNIGALPDHVFAQKQHSGRPPKHDDREAKLEQMKTISIKKRKVWRSVAGQMNLPTTTFYWWYKATQDMKVITNSVTIPKTRHLEDTLPPSSTT